MIRIWSFYLYAIKTNIYPINRQTTQRKNISKRMPMHVMRGKRLEWCNTYRSRGTSVNKTEGGQA